MSIIDKLTPDRVAKVNTFVLSRLSSQLKVRGSHLVITVGCKSELPYQDLSDYIVRWDESPDRVQMLERHLTWSLNDQATAFNVDTVIQDIEIRNRLPGLLLGE